MPYAFLHRAPRGASLVLLLSFVCLGSGRLQAQSGAVPQLINYQGRVTVNGTNFNGAGQFKFALVNSGASTTYWSNDGTSTAGSAPTAAVAVTVNKGLYSVLLGDTTLANMGAVPAAVFSHPDVFLRIWFNDGANGQQLLGPDQKIAAVAYAQMAAGLSLPATNSDGTEGVITQGGTRLLHAAGGSGNIFAGQSAGNLAVTGIYNTALGFQALQSLTDGYSNTAIGYQALQANTGSYGTALGYGALNTNIDGYANLASGAFALYANTHGNYNVAFGADALIGNTTGNNNTAVGLDSLRSNTTGGSNIALGYYAGNALTTGSNNIDIGNNGVAGDSGITRIGATGAQTKTFISGIRGVTTGSSGAVAVLIDANGQLGTVSSSRRYKEEIADMGDASDRLQALRPVTFRYKKPSDNGEKPLQFGLIAEEVAQAFPELVVYNETGEPETVKYQDLTPLLLNEVQKLRAEKDELRARIEKLETLVGPRPEAKKIKAKSSR